ncbi:MAG: GGDEF domain-containing protein [Dehalococcoidia bacterium]|nr:GGDEF domain-containing protein [Dehalococcoidia bacterium]
MQRNSDVTAGESLARDEETIGRAVWVSRFLALLLTAGVVGFFVITQADASWQYVAYPLLAGLPLAYGIVSARYIRLMHVDLLRRYQAHLMLRTIELEKMASHDGLTELYNRRYFYERFQEGLARARASKQTLALIVLDIDGLKKINDEYGHAVGDVMIANLAKVIDKHIRTSDVPARLGGDEFAVLMPDTDKRGAFALAQRLWQELEEQPMYEHDGMRLMLNVSIGVSGFPWGGEDVDEMMHWADSDMYANKVSRRLPHAATQASNKLLDDSGLDDFDRI